ncbi:urea ABC transporter substrate-binding protein [Labrys miyagiensis]
MASIKIGLMLAEQGPAGLWGPSAHACARLAIKEINTERGLLGRQIELVMLDAGLSGRSAAEAVHKALAFERIDGLIGMFPSYARREVANAIGDTVPFVYTPQFEGSQGDPHLLATGETSSELLSPAVEWLMRKKKAARFFLCGSDYIWPRASFATAKRIIADAGGIVTGEVYLPLGMHDDFDATMAAIRRSHSDVVLPHFLGLDAVVFHRVFASAGLAAKVLRLASAVDETVLYNLAEAATENLFLASAYFSSVRSRNNGAFLERYHTAYGDNPPPANAYGQSCYEGIYGLAALVEAAETLRTGDVRRAVGRAQQRRSARGKDRSPLVGHRHPIHLAGVEGLDVKILETI